MNDHQENLETLDTDIEFFDTDELPSLEDLIQELESAEARGYDTYLAPEPVATVNIESVRTQQTLESELREAYQRLFENEQQKQELAEEVGRVNENLKKHRWRAERERTEHYAFAVISIVREFLPILDNLNRALQTADNLAEGQGLMREQNTEIQNLEAQNFSNFVGGIELIYQQTIKFLNDLGVEEIKGVGQAFDPNIHEAVATEAKADLPPNTITEEVLRGYRLGDKLIRAAMVKVSTNH